MNLIKVLIEKMTAAHCITKTVKFSHAGVVYTRSVITNKWYPTIESMYTLYLGLQDKYSIETFNSYSEPTVKSSVQKLVVVSGLI